VRHETGPPTFHLLPSPMPFALLLKSGELPW